MSGEMRDVESSNIAAAGYDPDRQRLTVRFKSGDTYVYDGVPEQLGEDFFTAESVGKFFNGAIRSSFEGKKQEPVE